ncbi:MAG: SDR family oxidoreductase [Candidatus Binatia bacterium]|nr:SDR family oxidoreductase [Candidatus Binatia bacterium]
MSLLQGRVAVVTGASSGIGAAVAEALAQEGVQVVVGARRVEGLQRVCDRIREQGGEGVWVQTDLRDEIAVERLIATAVDRFGDLHILVNNAGVGTVRSIAEGRTEEWRMMVETNILGTLFACRAALRHMLPKGRGDVVNVTSAAAYEAWPYLSVYAATKAAVHCLSQGLRAEVAERGIRVMTIEVHNIGGTDFASGFDPTVAREAIPTWERLGLLRRSSGMLQASDAARAIVFQLAQPDPASVHHLTLRSRAN